MIPEHVMRELRYIEVVTARRVRNMRLGAYTSPQRGAGFDFNEHQPYREGDDVRRIDWNVTARLNAPFVRHMHADRELNAMIAIDVSRSMELGAAHRSKKELMTLITGSLLFSALSDHINVGFLAFADRVLEYQPPRRTRAAAWTILERCWALAPARGTTALAPAVRYLVSVLKRTSVVFLVSDFITDEDIFAGHDLTMLAARHDVIAVVPQDATEASLPPGRGYVQVRDLESGRRAMVTLSPGTRRDFADQMRRRRDALAQAFYRVPMDHVFVPTDGSPAEALMELFAARMAR
jgi:uncharacterized protein (DUF58 family)